MSVDVEEFYMGKYIENVDTNKKSMQKTANKFSFCSWLVRL